MDGGFCCRSARSASGEGVGGSLCWSVLQGALALLLPSVSLEGGAIRRSWGGGECGRRAAVSEHMRCRKRPPLHSLPLHPPHMLSCDIVASPPPYAPACSAPAPWKSLTSKGPAILTNSWTDEGQQALSTGVTSSVALQAANAALLSYRNTLVSAGHDGCRGTCWGSKAG